MGEGGRLMDYKDTLSNNPDDWRIVKGSSYDRENCIRLANETKHDSSRRYWRLMVWVNDLSEIEAVLWKPNGDVVFLLWEGREARRLLWDYEDRDWKVMD